MTDTMSDSVRVPSDADVERVARAIHENTFKYTHHSAGIRPATFEQVWGGGPCREILEAQARAALAAAPAPAADEGLSIEDRLCFTARGLDAKYEHCELMNAGFEEIVRLKKELAAALEAAALPRAADVRLFQSGSFALHSGDKASWKIDCGALTDGDLETVAAIAADRLGCLIGNVEGVPRGGLRFAQALAKHSGVDGQLIICDDVLTTGASMEAQRAGRDARGIVIFARGKCPDWVTPIFTCAADVREAVLVDALKFYANPESWIGPDQVNRDEMFDSPVNLIDHYGDKARAALASRPAMDEARPYCVIEMFARPDGGIRLRSPTHLGLILSGPNMFDVLARVPKALAAMRAVADEVKK